MTAPTLLRPPSPRGGPLPRVLLVDDEVAILDGLRRQLRRSFDVTTATGGAEALALMDAEEPFAVVVSDMRMPGMDGAAFLSAAFERSPDTVRLLLTGQADTESAIAAINQGQIYRFLTKPCPAESLATALAGAVEINRLVTAEKDVLERTLRGAVQGLLDVLSLASPRAFSRAVRVSELATEMAEEVGVRPDWEFQIAGMLAHVGAVTLPASVVERVDAGLQLTAEELAMLAEVPRISEELLAPIPRLEGVASAIGQQRLRFDGAHRGAGDPVGEDIPLVARVLRLATDFDALRRQRVPAAGAIAHLRKDAGAYDPRLLDAWEASHSVDGAQAPPAVVELADLAPGMVLVEDVTSSTGAVLVGQGMTVTEALLARLRNHAALSGLGGPIVVDGSTVPVSRP